MASKIRRKITIKILGLGLIFPLFSCGKENYKIKKEIIVDVMVFNYYDIPIFDVHLNGEIIGGSASLPDSPYGQFGTVAGVAVPIGSQKLNWRDAGSGKTFNVKNPLKITAEQIPSNAQSLGVHIYPDETAELIFSSDVLEQSKRGLAYAKNSRKIKSNNWNRPGL
jgi:hypothetical protein